MKIVILDRNSMGQDTDFAPIHAFGVPNVYDSTPDFLISERIKDAEVIITNKVKITAEHMINAEKLKLICVFATGFDNIDVIAAGKLGIAVCNVPGYSTDSVALFTVSTALALYSHLFEYREFVKTMQYTESNVANRLIPVYHELRGKTWGIVGYGNIGKAVARVAEALGATVLVNKRTPIAEVNCVDIDTLCKESDIITLHCPLNDESKNLIDSNRLSIMKKSAILVNEARGNVVDESAVAEAILSNKIAGFGCDVYSAEPMPVDHPYVNIKELPNVILTPHAAWGAYEARCRCVKIIAENIDSFLEGGLKNRVDKV